MKRLETSFTAIGRQPFVKALLAYPQAEIFLVGGVIRDALLNRPIKDYDLVVCGVPKTALAKTLTQYGKVSLVGKRFGVFKLRPKSWVGSDIDIALPRTEHVITGSGAYKDFDIQSDHRLPIEDDLSRRDFTINAMAWNLKTKTLVDPFGGKKDLQKKIITTVGAPEKRFAEDYSRLLRALRFSCQLNFTISEATWNAITKEIKKLHKLYNGERVVADEIIASELNKMITADPVKAMKLLDDSGALSLLMPELLTMKGCDQPEQWHSEGDVWSHTLLALEQLSKPTYRRKFNQIPSSTVIWSVLFHDVGKPATRTVTDRVRFNGHDMAGAKIFRAVASRLKLASAGVNVDGIEAIIAKHMLLATAKVVNLKNTTIEKYFFNPLFPGHELMMVMYADISASIQAESGKPYYVNYRELERHLKKLTSRRTTLPKPLVRGEDIMKLGITAGPRIGDLLLLAREAQLSGKYKTKKELLIYLKKQL